MTSSENKNELKSKTAIVIDDDHDVADSFSEYLELKNINVLDRGYNGKDAVNLYQRLRPDVIFLDVMMPDYSGFYALEMIKQIDPSAIIIATTADRTEETENRLVELGASYIAYKPDEIDSTEIFEVKKNDDK